MKIKNNFSKKVFCLISFFSLSFGMLIAANQNNEEVLNADAKAIETSTGVTMNAGESVEIPTINDWRKKVLVFEVKTDGTETQFQLKDPYVGCGIIRTKPDRGVHTADEVAYEYLGGSPYWGNECYSVSLGDDWYRWVVDLTHYKAESDPGQITKIKCLKGSNVQVRNLRTYEDMYIESSSLCSGSYGFLDEAISNWSSQTVTFDLRLPDTTQRRFQLCDSNKSGLSGFLFCEREHFYIQTADTWKYELDAPTSLGNDWYHFTVDLGNAKLIEGKTGAESVACIKNLPDTNDENPVIEMKNFGLYVEGYDPADDADITLKSNARTTIPDIPLWSLSTISFEVYHDSLDLNCEPQFIFGEKGKENYVTSYFGYKDIGGETALYLRNTSDEGAWWVKSSNQPVAIADEEGWYKWTINLSELRAEGSSGSETIGNILNRGSKDVYIRNFKVESCYNPINDADLVLKSNEQTEILDIPLWSLSTISFEIYHNTLDFNCDPQFIFIEDGKTNYVTSYFGYKDIGGETALYLRNTSDEGAWWVKSSNQPVAVENSLGWYKWTIDLSELRAEGSSGGETIGKILNRGANDVYIRNFKIESVQDLASVSDMVLEAGKFNTLEETIPYWQYSTISFDIYHNTLDISCDPQFQFAEEGNTKNTTGFFGYKSIYGTTGLYLRNATEGEYWVLASTQPVAIEGELGWYHWTINLAELGLGENCVGSETLGSILNRGAYNVYIKNFEVSTKPFVMIDKKDITVPFEEGLTAKINARIIDATGELKFESSDENVAVVDNTGEITFLSKGNCLITVTVKDNDEVREAVCKISCVGLKEHKILNLDELTDGENSIDFPLVTSVKDNVKYYTYDTVEDNNPSVVVRFLVSASYLEQNRQAITLWGPTENGLYDGDYGIWAVCYKGALVFDIYGNNGTGGIYVSGINTMALNGHNTLIQSMITNTDYYVEAGAIDLEELINEVQYSYFYIKVNGTLVWSKLDVAKDEFRNPIVAFTATGASRCKAKKVDLVDVTLITPDGEKVIQVADGLKLPEIQEPKVDDAEKKFIGWKTTDGTLWNFDSDRVDGEMTLTAEITSDYCTIDFNLNHGEDGVYLTKYIGMNMNVKPPVEDPNYDGYRFKWWSTSPDGQAFDFYNVIDSDVTLYAVWVKTFKVSFVYDNTSYLVAEYDENSYVQDPGWGYKDNPDFGEFLNRGMFELNEIANGRAHYYSLTPDGEKIDIDKAFIKVNSDKVIYIRFAEVETVKGNEEVYDPDTSKWDYVSIRDLEDTKFKTDEYYLTKYDTSTAEYIPGANNTTDSVILRGEIKLGDKFDGKNMNVGTIALRSNISAYNSINIWLRTKEVYLESKNNGKTVHLAFQSFENVDGLEEYLKVVDGVAYLKTDVYIPIEYGVLAVTTPGFEDYDRVYLKLNDCMVFDVVIAKYGKPADGATYRVGFVTDGDTENNSALSFKGVYPSYTIKFQLENGETVSEDVTLSKYSYVIKPTYQLPAVDGKEFVGWYDKNTKLLWDFGNDRVTKNLVLVPTYGYSVTLDPTDGKFADGRTDREKYNPRVQKVADGGKVKLPVDPIVTTVEIDDEYQHIFAGWEKEDGTLWDPENDVVTSNLVLKARWDTYVTITYYVEEEDYKWESKTVKYGEIVGSPRHGDPDSYDAYDDDEHEFLGWYIYDSKGKFVKIDLAELEANDNLEIFAIFDEPGNDNPGKKEPSSKSGCNSKKGCVSTSGANIVLLLGLAIVGLKKKKGK